MGTQGTIQGQETPALMVPAGETQELRQMVLGKEYSMGELDKLAMIMGYAFFASLAIGTIWFIALILGQK